MLNTTAELRSYGYLQRSDV